MINLIWLVPLLPLLSFAVIGLWGKSISKSLAGLIGCGSVLGAFIISLLAFFELIGSVNKSYIIPLFNWIHAGNFIADFSFQYDPLSALFLLIITGVGFLIHVYSTGYMHDDDGFARFFAYLNLFIFFMLLLVLGSNYLVMFVGWEGVGLCSYLLIGFWFKNNDYNNAAKKAFIMNRIGDLGFIIGIILIFVTFGSINYRDVFSVASSFSSRESTLIAITLCLFIGAMGKSAQIPLYTWLPDAMAGPTPVSALIHAATMVTAGIYMIARSNILFVLAPFTMDIVAGVGLFTAIFAASIGFAQNDIKKVLAYSTVSQLGYMFFALGLGAFTGAVFHVTTHAFFKALLFLSAGSVIHAMGGEQDIRYMGGLRKKLPVTFWVFTAGTAAIMGIPPLSGFFSKDEILANAFSQNTLLWIIGVAGAAMTAFYMFRVWVLTFMGEFRGTEKQEQHLHESPRSMTLPLIILAVLSIIGGFIGIPESLGGGHALEHFLAPVFADSKVRLIPHLASHETEYALMITAIAILSGVIYLGYDFYIKREQLPAAEGEEMNTFHKLIYNKYYIDEIYDTVFTKPLNWLSEQFYKFFELRFIDGIVNGTGTLVNRASNIFRYLQTGYVEFYMFAMVIGIILIFLFKMIG